MKRILTVALAQINPVAGAVARNTALVTNALAAAITAKADVLVTPEMALAGYPAEDLLGERAFVLDAEAALGRVAQQVPADMLAVLGTPMFDKTMMDYTGTMHGVFDLRSIDSLHRTVRNTVALARNGRVESVVAKALLPEYSVFDDARWVAPGNICQDLLVVNGVTVGFAICEDVWANDVADSLAARGAQVLFVANASPFTLGKPQVRVALLSALAVRTGLTVVYLNAVGGQDELVFDGGSMVVTPDRGVVFRAPLFEKGTFIVEVPVPDANGQTEAVESNLMADWPIDEAQVWGALVTGFGDYVRNNGFERVLLGLSGGLDSAVAAVLAVDALGKDAVRGIGMPGPYSSDHSVTDAERLAETLGVRFDLLSIKATYEAEIETLGGLLEGPGVAVAKENIQARLRALHLMTLANATNALVVNTGNRSEAAVGYFTLGGDSGGGYAPLKDLPKTLVYRLAEWRNENTVRFTAQACEHSPVVSCDETECPNTPPIPRNTITKPPSAELAPDQVDTNSLPPYEVLDFILALYLEEMASASDIVEALVVAGLLDRPEAEVTTLRILSMTDRAEHKRRQVAPGLKVTRRAFGKDRRVPITNGRRHHLDNA